MPENKSKLNKSNFKREANHRFSLIKQVVHQAKSANVFYLISAFFQIKLGLLVTFASIIHLITPMWLAAIFSLLGCVVTMLGIYQVYDVLKGSKSIKELARDAIERAIQNRN